MNDESSRNDTSIELPVLWLDENPEPLRRFARLLEAESSPLRIHVATTIREAEDELRTGDYSAAVFDCKLDDHDDTVNGAAYLLDVNERHKALPTFVYSGFLGDPLYSKHISNSLALECISKKTNIVRPLKGNGLFQSIHRHAVRYNRVKHLAPEAVSFSKFKRDPQRYAEELDAHWTRNGHWITVEMKRRNAIWAVVCGEEIVAASGDLQAFPDEEELMRFGEEFNRVPFAYASPPQPEESGPPDESGIVIEVKDHTHDRCDWFPTAFDNDHYPTLSVKIDESRLVADFDTGSITTYVPAEIVKKGFLDRLRESDGAHLGESYRYYTKKVSVTIHGERSSATGKMTINAVHEWRTSPFAKVNGNRQALVGRDLLRAFRMVVVLDTASRRTGCDVLEGHPINRIQ